jgi:hypothetical protein
MATNTHAWDEVWGAMEEAGIRLDYKHPGEVYLPTDENGVSYGQFVVDRITELRQTRLTIHQILIIAELIRTLAKAARQ